MPDVRPGTAGLDKLIGEEAQIEKLGLKAFGTTPVPKTSSQTESSRCQEINMSTKVSVGQVICMIYAFLVPNLKDPACLIRDFLIPF